MSDRDCCITLCPQLELVVPPGQFGHLIHQGPRCLSPMLEAPTQRSVETMPPVRLQPRLRRSLGVSSNQELGNPAKGSQQSKYCGRQTSSEPT